MNANYMDPKEGEEEEKGTAEGETNQGNESTAQESTQQGDEE